MKNAKLRAKAVDILHRANKRKMVREPGWFTETIDQLEIGKLRPNQAIHALNRKVTRETMKDAWSGEWCFLENIEAIIGASGTPPKPAQCRLGIVAARAGGIVTLHGPSGTGKTTCALRAATYTAITAGIENPIVAICGTRLGRMKPAELSDLIDVAASASIVILDDIDKGSKSETRASAILEILDTRERKQWTTTIVTSNRAGSELADQIEAQTEGYGLPIVNRLRRGIDVDFGNDGPEAITKEAIRQKLLKKSTDDEWLDHMENFGRLKWRGIRL